MNKKLMLATQYLLLALFVCSVGGYWYYHQAPDTIPQIKKELAENIRSLGPAVAYQDLKNRYADKDVDTKHNVAHLYGEALYAAKGIEGLTTCDTSFEFGCYHGFFTDAVAAEGVEIVRALDEVCHTANGSDVTSCQHGIGHGLMEYFGSHRLTDALQACTMTDILSPDAGCLTGVFMQYNVPLSVSSEGVFSLETRPLKDESRPYDPCLSVEHTFQPACYHELPQWWNVVFAHDFERIGSLCEAIPENAFRMSCYGGLGGIIASYAKYIPEDSAQLCMSMPSEPGRIQCLHNAAWVTYLSAGDLAGAQYLCKQKPEVEQMHCPPVYQTTE